MIACLCQCADIRHRRMADIQLRYALRQLRQLLADPAAILAMAQHNADYYQMWLRPEQQVRQALRQLETGEL